MNKTPPTWIKPDGSIDFSDLDDFDAQPTKPNAGELPADQATNMTNYGGAKSTNALGLFDCEACRGSGRFYSYTGRLVGNCFKCKGTGKMKTDPNVLRARRMKAAQKRANEETEKANSVATFLEQRADVKAWFERHEGDKNPQFRNSLWDALNKWGSLTPGQLNAVTNSIARDAEFDAKRAATRVEAAKAPDALDLSPLPSGMYAVPNGETRLKLRINHVTKGKWLNWIFVDDGAEYGQRRKYGQQRPNGVYEGQLVDQLRAILADPMGASSAYGRLVGCCGVCGRKLEDEESVALGIGPVCRGKFGSLAGGSLGLK